MFLKGKKEASDAASTETDRNIRDCLTHRGIQLDPHKICFYPAKRKKSQKSQHSPFFPLFWGKGRGEETLENLPVRGRENPKYVLRKISETGDSWTKKGEFTYKARTVKGSHMINLVKTLTASCKMFDFSPPRGSSEFLST